MKNKEKFADKIIDIALHSETIAIVEGKPVPCRKTNCVKCDFYGKDCDDITEWGESEYKGDQKLIEASKMLKAHCEETDCSQCIFSNGVLCKLSRFEPQYEPRSWEV